MQIITEKDNQLVAQSVNETTVTESHFEKCKRLAEQGDANSQWWLGHIYKSGLENVKQDCVEAFKWYKKAAEQDPYCYYDLGNCYRDGCGVEQNDVKAFESYKTAAEHQNFEAQLCLADCYYYGKGVEQDYSQAAYWYEKHGYSEGNMLSRWLNAHIKMKNFEFAKQSIEEFYSDDFDDEKNYKDTCITAIELAEQLEEKNKQLEQANEQLKAKEKELEDMMSMFAHKFRSPLDAILYNTSHDNDPKLYAEAAQTMRGLLDVFSIISTDDQILKDKIKNDHQGHNRLNTVLSKTLDNLLLHLLSSAGTEKIHQHYMSYAKAQGKIDATVSPKEWYNDYFELERQLQTEWEQSFSALIQQSVDFAERLNWIEQHFFKLEIIGFARDDIHFKEYGFTESFLTILLNEILVNAFKYYFSETRQPVILEWSECDGQQILSCRNPSSRRERTASKGSGKGHSFLSNLARKIGSQFTRPKSQDNFVLEFAIPSELLISNA